MTSPLHSTLVLLTLLSQLLGSVAVLCVEADGRMFVEFGTGGCCGLGESGETGEPSGDEDECGECDDLALSLGDRLDRDREQIEVAHGFVLELVPLPCCGVSCSASVARAATNALLVASSTVDLVRSTVVLTC